MADIDQSQPQEATPQAANDRVAVLVIHGMGQQNPYETLDHFARRLVDAFKADGRACSLRPVLLNQSGKTDWTEARVCLSVDKPKNGAEEGTPGKQTEVTVAEYYWAPITQDKINYQDTLKWLTLSDLRPLRYLAANLQELFNNSGFNPAVAAQTNRGKRWWLAARSWMVPCWTATLLFLRELARIALIYLPILGGVYLIAKWLGVLKAASGAASKLGLPEPFNAFFQHITFLGIIRILPVVFLLVLVPTLFAELLDLVGRKNHGQDSMRRMALVSWSVLALAFVAVFVRILVLECRYVGWVVPLLWIGWLALIKVSLSLQASDNPSRSHPWWCRIGIALLILLLLCAPVELIGHPIGNLLFAHFPAHAAYLSAFGLRSCGWFDRHLLALAANFGIWLACVLGPNPKHIPAAADLLAVAKALVSLGMAYAIRGFLMGYIGDVAVYVNSDAKTKNYQAHSQIIDECATAAQALLQDKEFDRVLIAAHSLGTVIAVDVINELLVRAAAIPSAPGKGVSLAKCLPKLQGLLTFGSPLNKIWYFFRETVDDTQAIRAQVIGMLHSFRSMDSGRNYEPYTFSGKPLIAPGPSGSYGLAPNFRWMNVWAPLDAIAGPLRFVPPAGQLFPVGSNPLDPRRSGFYKVDVQYRGRLWAYWKPFLAHVMYWDDKELYKCFIDNFRL